MPGEPNLLPSTRGVAARMADVYLPKAASAACLPEDAVLLDTAPFATPTMSLNLFLTQLDSFTD